MKKLSALALATTFLFPFSISPVIVQAAEQQRSQEMSLTYQQAISRALEHSYTLKNTKADVERAEKVRDKAASNVKDTPNVGEGPNMYSQYNQTVNSNFASFGQASINYQKSKEQVRIDEDRISVSVRQAYNDVLQAEIKKKFADLALQNEELQRSVTQYKYQNGIVSNAEKVKSDGTYQAAKSSKEAADKAVIASYEKFNQLVGLSAQARPVLTEQPKMENMPEVDLELHINRILSDNPKLVQVSKGIDFAKLGLDLYMYNAPNSLETYEAKQIDVIKAENSYADAKEKTDKELRSLYYSIRQMEDTYKALQEKQTILEEALRIAKVQYDVGMATKAEFSKAQLDVEDIKAQLFELAVKHDNAVQAFYKPWAATGE